MDTPFDVSVVVAAQEGNLGSIIRQNQLYFEREEPIIDTPASLKLNIFDLGERASLLNRMTQAAQRPSPQRFVVLSDALVKGKGEQAHASELASAIRSIFIDHSEHLCGLVGLVRGECPRTTDIDKTIDVGSLEAGRLKKTIVAVANGLWLKSCVRPQEEMSHRDAISINLVQSEEELRECLALRHRVYSALGYLEDAVASCNSRVEIDSFDIRSFHFSATDHNTGDVVGTLRLVMPVARHQQKSLLGYATKVRARQREWVWSIARKSDAREIEVRFCRKLIEQPFLPFPILVNSNFGEKWPKFLQTYQFDKCAEISRVVVSPRYRGLGISTVLLRAAIAAAYDLHKRYLLLECIPSHAKLYEKVGFISLDGRHRRAQGLDQIAVGMQFRLDQSPTINRFIAQANKDIEMLHRGLHDEAMLSGTKKLCLCRLKPCWKQPGYLLQGQDECPLKEGFHEIRPRI